MASFQNIQQGVVKVVARTVLDSPPIQPNPAVDGGKEQQHSNDIVIIVLSCIAFVALVTAIMVRSVNRCMKKRLRKQLDEERAIAMERIGGRAQHQRSHQEEAWAERAAGHRQPEN